MNNDMGSKTKEEKLALLAETAATYTSQNRAVHGGQCHYHWPGTPGCAIGRLIKDEGLKKRLRGSVLRVWEDLPKDVRAWGMNFLGRLQVFHDDTQAWCETGLTKTGKTRMAEMQSSIELGTI